MIAKFLFWCPYLQIRNLNASKIARIQIRLRCCPRSRRDLFVCLLFVVRFCFYVSEDLDARERHAHPSIAHVSLLGIVFPVCDKRCVTNNYLCRPVLHRSWSDLPRSSGTPHWTASLFSDGESSCITPSDSDEDDLSGPWPAPAVNPASVNKHQTGHNPAQQQWQRIKGTTPDAREWLVNPSRYKMVKNIGKVGA